MKKLQPLLTLTTIATLISSSQIMAYSYSSHKINNQNNISLTQEALGFISYKESENYIVLAYNTDYAVSNIESVLNDITYEFVKNINTPKILNGIHDGINKKRQEANLKPLQRDMAIDSFSDMRAEEILTLYQHNRPNGEALQYGENMNMSWEVLNINAKFFSDDIIVFYTHRNTSTFENKMITNKVNGWYNSDPHRENILNPHYVSHGLGLRVRVFNPNNIPITSKWQSTLENFRLEHINNINSLKSLIIDTRKQPSNTNTYRADISININTIDTRFVNNFSSR